MLSTLFSSQIQNTALHPLPEKKINSIPAERKTPGLRQPKSAAGRGEAGGELHSHKTKSELLKQLFQMKRRRRKEERQALIPSQ